MEKRPDPTTQVQGQTTRRIALILEAARLPRVEVRGADGTTMHKAVGLTELLTILDRSAVLEALKNETTRTIALPPLPPRTLLASATEDPRGTSFKLTGWLPAATIPLVYGDRAYTVDLPPLAWSAGWRSERLEMLKLAIVGAKGTVKDPVELGSTLYRWPFSNVYGDMYYGRGSVCWPTMRNVNLRLSDIPRLGVGGFLATRNNADLFGKGRSHNSPHEGYAEFLEACQENGLDPDWLIPFGTNLRGLHDE